MMFDFENSRHTPAEHREDRQTHTPTGAISPSTDRAIPARKMWPSDQTRKPGSSGFTITRTTRQTEWFNPAPPSPFERHEVELRHRVAVQLQRANTQHLFAAVEKARSGEKTLAAHGVSLFYVGLNPSDPLGFRVYTMSRWGYSSPENDDLSQMLQGLDEAAHRFITAAAGDGRRWDPRGPDYPLVNIGDFPASPAITHYVGLGVQTLDTDQCRWIDIVDSLVRMDRTASAQALREVPREAAALLVDGSVLRVVNDRNEPMGYNGVRNHRTLQAGQFLGLGQPPGEEFGETLRRAWPYLKTLSRTLQNCSGDR